MRTRFRTNWRGRLILQVGRVVPSKHPNPMPGRETVVAWRDARVSDLPGTGLVVELEEAEAQP